MIRPSIEEMLNNLVAICMFEKVEHSHWAVLIIPVLMQKWEFHIYDVYKVTINQDLDVDQYSLPKPEDIFVMLTGGLKFSKLDFSQA